MRHKDIYNDTSFDKTNWIKLCEIPRERWTIKCGRRLKKKTYLEGKTFCVHCKFVGTNKQYKRKKNVKVYFSLKHLNSQDLYFNFQKIKQKNVVYSFVTWSNHNRIHFRFSRYMYMFLTSVEFFFKTRPDTENTIYLLYSKHFSSHIETLYHFSLI